MDCTCITWCVWGIVLLLVAGFLDFATDPVSPWNEVLAVLFGVGAGLTLDEFALWIYLRDVYWAEEGRASFDAVVVAAALGGLVVLWLAPFDLPRNTSSVTTLFIAVTLDVALSAAAILKGKPMLGLIGVFIALASLIGLVRLAAPRSFWARRLYGAEGPKLARAEARWARITTRRRRIANAIAGAPELDAAHPPE